MPPRLITQTHLLPLPSFPKFYTAKSKYILKEHAPTKRSPENLLDPKRLRHKPLDLPRLTSSASSRRARRARLGRRTHRPRRPLCAGRPNSTCRSHMTRRPYSSHQAHKRSLTPPSQLAIRRRKIEEFQTALCKTKNLSRLQDTMTALTLVRSRARMEPIRGAVVCFFDTVDGYERFTLQTRRLDVEPLQPLVDGGHLGAVSIVAVLAVGAGVDELTPRGVSVADAGVVERADVGLEQEGHGAGGDDALGFGVVDHFVVGLFDETVHVPGFEVFLVRVDAA